VISTKGTVALQVNFSDADTNPLAGRCDRKAIGRSACNVDYNYKVAVTSTWQTVTVNFAQLNLPPWAELEAAKAHGFLKDSLYSVHFQLQPPAPKIKLPPFDIFVANVYFTGAS
jgi:hypothetical protein